MITSLQCVPVPLGELLLRGSTVLLFCTTLFRKNIPILQKFMDFEYLIVSTSSLLLNMISLLLFHRSKKNEVGDEISYWWQELRFTIICSIDCLISVADCALQVFWNHYHLKSIKNSSDFNIILLKKLQTQSWIKNAVKPCIVDTFYGGFLSIADDTLNRDHLIDFKPYEPFYSENFSIVDAYSTVPCVSTLDRLHLNYNAICAKAVQKWLLYAIFS